VIPPRASSAPALSLYSRRKFLGFLRPLPAGRCEALDRERRSLGIFTSRSAAADAVEAAVEEEARA
jgi:hypothetical protein